MIRWKNTENVMRKLTTILRAATAPPRVLMPLMIWMSLTAGCVTRTVVIPSDQTETFVRSNHVFTAPYDGVFMGGGRYRQYRRAVADRVLELEANGQGKN